MYSEKTGSERLGVWSKGTQLTRDTAPFPQLQADAAAAACASCGLILKGSSQGRGRGEASECHVTTTVDLVLLTVWVSTGEGV